MKSVLYFSSKKQLAPQKKENFGILSQRSDMAEEIIMRKPDFTERWALIIFFLILILMLTATWFVKYPDIIQAKATLTAINAPKDVITRQEGKLVKLFVSNDDEVTEGQTIAWIESTARHKDVITLANALDSGIAFLSRNETEKVSDLFKSGLLGLGEIQAYYQQFVTAWQQFNDYLSNGYYFKRKHMLFEDLNYLKKMQYSLEQEELIVQEDVLLTQEGYDANYSLFKDRVISKQELRDERSKLLSKKMNLPQLKASLLSNKNLEQTKHKEIDELEHTISQQKIIFQQAMQTLKSLSEDWKKKYIITSPISGKIMFLLPLQLNQFVQSGKAIGLINPPNSLYYALVTLPQSNFGKVSLGQKIQLRFDAYPYQEYGFVEGNLSYISQVASDSGFLANIVLNKGLITNYNKKIQYISGLKSEALVITSDTRLLQRFYHNLVKGINNKD